MGKRSVPWGTTKQTITSNQHNHPEITKVSRFPSRNKGDKAKPINFLKEEKHLQLTHSTFAFITFLLKMIKESTPTLEDSCDNQVR